MLPLLILVPSIVSLLSSAVSVAAVRKAYHSRVAALSSEVSARVDAKLAQDTVQSSIKQIKSDLDIQHTQVVTTLSTHIAEVEKMEKEILTAKSNAYSYAETAKILADTARKHKEEAKQHAEEASKESTMAQTHATNAETFATTAGEHSDKAAGHSSLTLRNVQKAAVEAPGVQKCRKCGVFSARYFVTDDSQPICANCDPKGFAARKG